MNTTLTPGDFNGTTIKTAFEQMRANAIINAENSIRGVSIIDFNIGSFLGPRRQQDALFILGHWAIQPIRLNTSRFIEQPQRGKDALEHRARQLINHLENRAEVSHDFAATILEHIQKIIAEEINLLAAIEPQTA